LAHPKKDTEELKAGEENVSKNTQAKSIADVLVELKTDHPGSGESKNFQAKPTTGDWVDSKNVQTFKPTSSGEWVSSKNAQISPKKSAIG
jgi:hypothetical protein